VSGPVFEIVYREKLWRVSVSDYRGDRRLTFWAHYRDAKTGEWRACGGKREAPGFIVPADRQPELEAAIVAMGAALRSSGS
jgi:hypothetical protein